MDMSCTLLIPYMVIVKTTGSTKPPLHLQLRIPVYPDGLTLLLFQRTLRIRRPHYGHISIRRIIKTVYSVVVHEGGSNYSSRATVRFSGGGCLLLPAGSSLTTMPVTLLASA